MGGFIQRPPTIPDDLEYVPVATPRIEFYDGRFFILGFEDMEGTEPHGVRYMDVRTDVTGRGQVGGEPVDLFVQSAEAGEPSPHTDKHWRQAGVRIRGFDDVAEVRKVLTSGPTPDDEEELAVFEVELNEPATRNYRQVVPALGDTATCSLTVTCRGDVAIEALTLWFDETVDRW